MTQTPQEFVDLIASLTAPLANKPLTPELYDYLQEIAPADGDLFARIESMCRNGVADGWLCAREQGGIKFGRAIKAGAATHGFSVDVVEMNDVVGPHHAHPNGEIDMVMPIEGEALFDGAPRGWRVYGPGSAHHPTVTGGKALVLYLLPAGAIEFTRT